MLDASKLMGAGAESSKNPLIKGLLEEVQTYNMIVSPMNPQPKADQLLRVCQVGSWYCTSKPPQPEKPLKPGGGKNKLRWAAVKDLLEQIGSETAALNLKMLRGPSDFKQINNKDNGKNQSYWLELADPQHRPGYQLAGPFAAWLLDPLAIKHKKSFWRCIGTDNSREDLSVIVKYYPELEGQAAQYMENRGMVRFNVDGKLVDLADVPWDTSLTKTHFSGTGWAIFVVSPTGKIFGGTHEAGKHHHSSFLGGGFVMAAGEIACYDGISRITTAKSGHYGPTAENLQKFVNTFPQIRGDAIIFPKFTANNLKAYTVQDFRTRGLAATPLTKAEVEAWLIQYPQANTVKFKAGALDKMA